MAASELPGPGDSGLGPKRPKRSHQRRSWQVMVMQAPAKLCEVHPRQLVQSRATSGLPNGQGPFCQVQWNTVITGLS